MSAGHFLLEGLNISREAAGFCFSYTPLDRGKVHNANLLAAALISRLYAITGEKAFLHVADQAVSFSVSKQNPDGSWFYGEHDTQKWIDSFHTGYNLVALESYRRHTGNESVGRTIQKGFDYYRVHFATPDGFLKYYHNRLYPIDIHTIAQSLITLVELNRLYGHALELPLLTWRWAVSHMQSHKGFFFYQQGRQVKNRISYMRWSQAWMLYAMAILLQGLCIGRFASAQS